jgi:hypothetical protein
MKAKRQSIARNAAENAEGLRNLCFLCALLLAINAVFNDHSLAQDQSSTLAKEESSAAASGKPKN